MAQGVCHPVAHQAAALHGTACLSGLTRPGLQGHGSRHPLPGVLTMTDISLLHEPGMKLAGCVSSIAPSGRAENNTHARQHQTCLGCTAACMASGLVILWAR